MWLELTKRFTGLSLVWKISVSIAYTTIFILLIPYTLARLFPLFGDVEIVMIEFIIAFFFLVEFWFHGATEKHKENKTKAWANFTEELIELGAQGERERLAKKLSENPTISTTNLLYEPDHPRIVQK